MTLLKEVANGAVDPKFTPVVGAGEAPNKLYFSPRTENMCYYLVEGVATGAAMVVVPKREVPVVLGVVVGPNREEVAVGAVIVVGVAPVVGVGREMLLKRFVEGAEDTRGAVVIVVGAVGAGRAKLGVSLGRSFSTI